MTTGPSGAGDGDGALAPHDIEAIERATLAAVSPGRFATVPGWLVPLGDGPIGRARSAVPLRFDPARVDGVAPVMAAYAAAGLPPAFRLAEVAGLEPVRERLMALGLRREQPTWVMTADLAMVRARLADQAGSRGRVTGVEGPVADLIDRPDPDWAGVFLGDGFDPVEGAHRVAVLARADTAWYARVRVDGRAVAVGVAVPQGPWVGIHGMRTTPVARGRGHATQVIARLLAAAAGCGGLRAFLQVEDANAAARRLYASLGFTPAWCYAYWR